MTVIRPNSISGITSITAQANEINVFRSNGLIAGLNLNGVNFNTTAGISTLAALKVTGNVDVAGVLTYQDVTNVDSLGIGTFRTGINVSGGQLDVGSNIKLGNAGVVTATSFVGSGAQLTGITQTTINSNTNNYLITGTGTANTLQGEANLTFDGTGNFVQTGSASASIMRVETTANDGDALIQADGRDSSGNLRRIMMRTDAGADQYRIISADTSYNLALCTGNAPRVLIAGNSAATSIGGSNVFNAMLTVQGDISGALFQLKATENTNRLMVSGTNANGVEMNLYDEAGGQKGILGVSGTEFFIKAPNNSAPLTFYTHNGSSIGERLRIRSDGKVVIGTNYTGGTLSVTGNLITDDGTNGRVTIQADGTSTNQILSTTTGFGSYCNMKYQAADHIFLYGGTERFRLKNDGRVVLNNAAVGSNEYLTLGPNGSTPCDMAFRLNNDNDARIKFYDGGSTLRGLFGYTTYANNSAYPNFHDSFYLQTDPSSNGTLATGLRISNSGQFLKPLTYQFLVETNGQSVSGGWTKLTGLTPDSTHCTGVSNGTYWSNSNSRFTAPVTGTYNFFIGGFSSTADGGSTTRYMYVFRINGGNFYYGFGGNYSAGNTPMAGGSLYYKLNVNDYVEVYYYSAISATWGENSHRFFWGGYLVG